MKRSWLDEALRTMLGAVIGDIAGSIYEFDNHRSKEFELFGDGVDFTDDTVAAIVGSVAEAGFGIPGGIASAALSRLPHDMCDVLTGLYEKGGVTLPGLEAT